MMKALGGIVLAGILVGGGWLCDTAQAALTPQQRAKGQNAKTQLSTAARLVKAKKFAEAGEAFKQAQKLVSELQADGVDAKAVAPLIKQLATLHGDLELEGVKLPPLEMAAESEPAKGGAAPTKAPAGTGRPPAAGEVSFTKQVVPLLVSKCGGCHVSQSKGGFSALTYEALMKGSKDGVVLTAKASGGSRIVQLIKEGDMPRGGGKVSDEELAMLCQWIDQGAKFDGANPAANITDPSLIAAVRGANKTEVSVQMATGKETVHFTTDIGPVLVEQCYSCHGAGRRAQANFDLDYFKGLLKGGDSGSAIKAGKASESLLIKKLRGTAADGDRMPKDKPPLPEATIAKIEKWIDEGAKFDGHDASMPLATVVAVAHAESISHEELSLERAKRAEHDWKLVLPDGGNEHEDTENFVIYGNTGKDSLKEVARLAELEAGKLQKIFKLPAGPLVKGRMAIFIFDKKYDYGEVGRMMENRELPPESRGHWRYNFIDANVFILPAKNNEYSLAGLLGQQIAAVVVASQGFVPHWFAEGSGRAVTVNLDPKDARPRRWEDDIPAILSSGGNADTLLKGSGEDADVLAYGFVKFLRGDAGRYQTLLSSVKANMPFDAAFKKAYGAEPAAGAAAWAANPSRRGR